jgi:hypothetical protein
MKIMMWRIIFDGGHSRWHLWFLLSLINCYRVVETTYEIVLILTDADKRVTGSKYFACCEGMSTNWCTTPSDPVTSWVSLWFQSSWNSTVARRVVSDSETCAITFLFVSTELYGCVWKKGDSLVFIKSPAMLYIKNIFFFQICSINVSTLLRLRNKIYNL